MAKKLSIKNIDSLLAIAGKIIVYTIVFLASFSWMAASYKIEHFGDAKIDEMIFYIFNGLEGSNISTLQEALKNNLVWLLFTFVIFSLPLFIIIRRKIVFRVSYRRRKKLKTRTYDTSNIKLRNELAYAIILFVATFGYLLNALSFGNYIVAQLNSTKLYDKEYTDPKKVALTFPETKRNLIYIYLESAENTMASKNNGGAADISYIPELEEMAIDKTNISFSNTSKPIGGGTNLNGTTWTVGGIVAQSAGIPLKNSIGYDGNSMGKFNKFIPGAYTLGDVLKNEGYNQSFILGSEASFGGRDKLLKQHGAYKIFDYKSAQAAGKISKDYFVWWGYEDKKLFEYAKEEATQLAGSNKPFNLQLLTVDAHFNNGYLDETCPIQYDKQYFNVYSCSSKQVSDFVGWVKDQPFAGNTTIILSGDHINMQTAFFEAMFKDNPKYQRTIYNVIINSAIKEVPESVRHNRTFSTMDMYPTTLAAMGVKIAGDRLGLGTNLFSGKKTLPEIYGTHELNNELTKRSNFYDNKIILGVE